MATLAAQDVCRLPAADSGCLSRLRVGERASHKLGDAVTDGVWNVGSQHEAELQHMRAPSTPCSACSSARNQCIVRNTHACD
jgi:hypothetical protein